MYKRVLKVETCIELLKSYDASKKIGQVEKLVITGVGARDVYNITAPFMDSGRLTIAGRVEDRKDEISETAFFVEDNGNWVLRKNTKTYKKLQDPFFTRIKRELVFGGVEIFTSPENEKRIISWRTLFFRGKNIDELELFAAGPSRMKDIRLVELPDGKIGVFTRPQGEVGGRGQIGFIKINSLDDLSDEVILKARIFDDQFVKEEWGGSNEPHVLKNGLVGVLGHIAYMDEAGAKHYHAMTYAINPDTLEKSPIKIIAARKDFAPGSYKRQDIEDVIFSGGIQRQRDGNAVLYAGVSDAEAHRMVIADPFIEYEK